MILAQFAGYTLTHLIIIAIIIAACCAILYVALQQMGIQIPAFVSRVLWIVAVAVVCIMAVKFIAGL